MSYDFPANPAPGDIYVAPVGGQTYVWAPPKWLVQGVPPVGPGYVEPSVAEAPIDGKQYGREDAQWTEVVIPADDWNTMINKPATFPYATPIPQADVNNLNNDLDSLDGRLQTAEANDISHNTAIADAQTKNAQQDTRLSNLEAEVPAWGDITGKPSTFPPTLPIVETDVVNLVADLAAKAPLASPTFTGDPKSVTPATADDDTSIATTAHVQANAALKVSKTGDTMSGPLVVGALLSTSTGYHIRSGDAFIAADVNAVLANTGAGNVFLRPQGYGSTTGQFALASTGAVTVPGPVTVAADPTAPLQLATKQYVDARIATVGGVTISDTPPASPTQGKLWYESDSGNTYIWYDDGTSAQWVMTGPGGLPPMPEYPMVFDTNGDAVVKFGANIVIRIKPTGLILTKDDIEIFSVSV
jgi:hypothetical protein